MMVRYHFLLDRRTWLEVNEVIKFLQNSLMQLQTLTIHLVE